MIAILSPAKKVRMFQTDSMACRPVFLEAAVEIVEALRRFASWQLESLLMTSPGIAMDAFLQYRAFDPAQPGTPAMYAYQGLVYRHLAPSDFTEADCAFANEHLRILSAVYGLLRPMDAILPCRLEMQCKLPVGGSKNLYDFWGSRLYQALSLPRQPIVNLASEEYAKAVRRWLLPSDDFIDVVFLAWYKGKQKVLPAWAKMARGQMARYLIKNRLEYPEQLQQFDYDGYAYVPELSYHNRYVFVKG